jgi:hypothetical protein
VDYWNLLMTLVQREDIDMREAISPKQRFFVTLCFLASGLTFENLKFETAIALVTWYSGLQTCPYTLANVSIHEVNEGTTN